jgi:hypothetical protein
MPEGLQGNPALADWGETQCCEGVKHKARRTESYLITSRQLGKLSRLPSAGEATESELWDDMMRRMKDFYRDHGHSSVSVCDVALGPGHLDG